MYCSPWHNSHRPAERYLSSYRTGVKDIIFAIWLHRDVGEARGDDNPPEPVLCPPTTAAEAISRISVHHTAGNDSEFWPVARIAADFASNSLPFMICSAHLLDEVALLFRVDDVVVGAAKNGIPVGIMLLAPTTWLGGLTVMKVISTGHSLSEPTVVEASFESGQLAQVQFCPNEVVNDRPVLGACYLVSDSLPRISRSRRLPVSLQGTSTNLPEICQPENSLSQSIDQVRSHALREEPHPRHDICQHPGSLLYTMSWDIGECIRRQANIPLGMPISLSSVPDTGKRPTLTWQVLLILTIYGHPGVGGMDKIGICDALVEQFKWFKERKSETKWKRAVSRTLSDYPVFQRVTRRANAKSGSWVLNFTRGKG
ncbi:hypothetical protein B0H11DRAFT_1917535 [Mycena galericulata]|nr:hypothetical protein B0H11DRAFT_1917535 [Mycena galericulata]